MKNSNLTKILIITVAWVLISQVLFYYCHFYLISNVPESILETTTYTPFYVQTAYFIIALIGSLFFGFYMVSRKPKLRSFSGSIIRIVILFFIVTILSVSLVTSLIVINELGMEGISKIPEICIGVLLNKASLMSTLIWALVLAGTQFMLQVNDKFGQGVLKNFLIGKYFNPTEEDRIFMFLDLKSSTTIAEKIGHKKFFEFIREAFKDITESILSHKGEIYQYVGDEVVISWKMKNGISKANSINCYFAIKQKLSSLSENYLKRYRAVPIFKAGLHHGSVTVGEIGVIKKDIVFSGDVLNTTARIQEQCNHYNVKILVSGSTLALMKDQCKYEFEKLGEFKLRGKEQKVDLFSLKDLNQ